MLRQDRIIRMQVHELLDACLFAVSFWLAYTLRANPDIIELFNLDPVTSSGFSRYMWLYIILIPSAPMILEAQGFYNRPLLFSRRASAWLLFKGCLLTSLGLILLLFLFRFEMARGVIVLFGVISFALISLKEELVLQGFRSRLAGAQLRRRFILLGAGEETTRLTAQLRTNSAGAVEIIKALDLNAVNTAILVELLHEHSVNGVIISAKRSSFDQVEDAVRVCELEGVEVWLVSDFFRTQISRTSFDDFYGQPVLVFRTTPETSWQGVIKQVIDFVGSLGALIGLSWFLALIALLVKLTSPGPIFFRQQRSGLNGRPFTLYKFRTMVTNAEQLKHELAAMNEMNGPVFKVTNDPRVTPVGKFLRKYSIDEFPQLFNVLRGEMSLVGPRPLPVDEVKRFNDLAHRRRLSVKPGLTCLWQVGGRNEVRDFKDWVRLDLEYIDNWSLWLDVKILCLTVPAVLAGTGAK